MNSSKNLKLIAALLLIVGSFASCANNTVVTLQAEDVKNVIEDFNNVYYIVGYDGGSVVGHPEIYVYGIIDENGNYVGDSVKVIPPSDPKIKSGGYILISENLKDSLLVYDYHKHDKHEDWYIIGDLLNGIIEFPPEIITPYDCQWKFFPEEYRYVFKVNVVSYRPLTKEEHRRFVEGRAIQSSCWTGFLRIFKKHVIITSISKIQ